MEFDARPLKTGGVNPAAALEAEVIAAQYRIIPRPLPALHHIHTHSSPHTQPPAWYLQFCSVNSTVLKLIKMEMHVYCEEENGTLFITDKTTLNLKECHRKAGRLRL